MVTKNRNRLGVTHVFSCLNICHVPRKLFEHKASVQTSEVNLVVKLVKCTNSYEGQRAGDLRLEHVCTAQPADRKWRVLHKIPRFT